MSTTTTSASAGAATVAAANETAAAASAVPAGKAGHTVCRVGDIPEGGRKIVQIGNKSIGVFHLKGGRFYALLNLCPHQFAPLCAGRVTGTMSFTDKVGEFKWERDGEIIRCPWHAWEFDITTGRSIFNPHKVRTRSFPVSVAQPDMAAEAEPGTPAAESACAETCDHAHPQGAGKGTDAEGVESFPVSIENSLVIVHV